jgi:hypothetical protein
MILERKYKIRSLLSLNFTKVKLFLDKPAGCTVLRPQPPPQVPFRSFKLWLDQTRLAIEALTQSVNTVAEATGNMTRRDRGGKRRPIDHECSRINWL